MQDSTKDLTLADPLSSGMIQSRLELLHVVGVSESNTSASLVVPTEAVVASSEASPMPLRL